MKKILTTALFLGVLAAFKAQSATAQVHVNISIGGFYDRLAPYGEWVNCDYGDCWVPERVDAHWQPYTNGEWIYTDYGWTWASYDPWGDDPYHYGTWAYQNRYGWAWIPGTVWAPAWVTWSYSDNYIGWAPLPPSYRFGYSGYSGRPIVLASSRYVFVPTNRFIGSNIRTVRVAPQQTSAIFRQTTPITQFGVTGGIVRNTALPLERIQRATRSHIQTRNITAARTAPRPITGWTRDSRRQVSIVAPAQEVRQAISARPQKASRSMTSGSKSSRDSAYRGQDTRQHAAPAIQRQAPAPQVQRQQAKAAPLEAHPNPGNLEKPSKGQGQAKQAQPEKGNNGKAKGKDKKNR